ncbi:sulfotransferase domain-containing protein [Porticoccus sp.]
MSSKVIDLMIVGAQKAGTTSLKTYLGQHPAITTHLGGEFEYFVNDMVFKGGLENAWEYSFPKKLDSNTVVAKSVGIMYLKEAMLRLYEHNPEVKLVALLRNPVDRVYSAYWYARRKGMEDIQSFEEALQANPDRFGNDWLRRRCCDYLNRGRYAEHIEALYSVFPKENITIYEFEEFKKNTSRICNIIFSELGVDSQNFQSDKLRQRHNASAMPRYAFVPRLLNGISVPNCLRTGSAFGKLRRLKRRIIKWNEKPYVPVPMEKETRKRLIAYYRPYNRKLFDLLDWDDNLWG